MRLKQGGFRKLPDGYLHLNNYSHRKDSGLCGSLYERVMPPAMQRRVEEALKYKALDEDLMSPQRQPRVHYKAAHGAVRFRKDWLKENFKAVVKIVMNDNPNEWAKIYLDAFDKEFSNAN